MFRPRSVTAEADSNQRQLQSPVLNFITLSSTYNTPSTPMFSILSFLYSILASLMSHLTNLLLKLARDADFSAASRAPLDTDGAHPNTHAAEATVAQIIDFCTNPPVSLSDSVCPVCPCCNVCRLSFSRAHIGILSRMATRLAWTTEKCLYAVFPCIITFLPLIST